MGGALILAAAGAALAVLLAVRLWVVLRPRAAVPRRSLSLLVVAGSGGHTTEILRLLETLSDAYSPRHYVIADTDDMSAHKINSFELSRADRNPSTTLPEYHIHRVPRSREVQQSWPSSALSTLYSLWFSFPLTHRVKPDLLLDHPRNIKKVPGLDFNPVQQGFGQSNAAFTSHLNPTKTLRGWLNFGKIFGSLLQHVTTPGSRICSES
ncbi:UDP-N-acetylglucosamine transferase subunit ALG14 homolog isoform X3 [Phacochoerus africanus]|uniref:UDP-N-acetylglucosamine transferase subunit ALG14 homolog isoform X3 n=1 Tax=Phacochoerus africanus TaxID=41426 RepID=UPI001FD9AF0C|nr:UDP-N-acetylglucosamine transferase subunit ALG14 homolog isoform X3 [Phacochoerus africanus]